MFDGILSFLRRALRRADGRGTEQQYGAIPWRRAETGIEFLMITSRRTRRWVFPKGGRIELLTGRASAAQEAFEEAGVEGRIASEPAGAYSSIKRRDTGDVPIRVEMFPLEVDLELDEWPEMAERQRRWVGTEEACKTISEPGLVQMIRAIAASAGEIEKP